MDRRSAAHATVAALPERSMYSCRQRSLNDLIRPEQKRRRHRETQHLRGPHIDHELELRWLFDGEIAGLVPLRILSTRPALRRDRSMKSAPYDSSRPLSAQDLCGPDAGVGVVSNAPRSLCAEPRVLDRQRREGPRDAVLRWSRTPGPCRQVAVP